jgi:hypothetical protein
MNGSHPAQIRRARKVGVGVDPLEAARPRRVVLLDALDRETGCHSEPNHHRNRGERVEPEPPPVATADSAIAAITSTLRTAADKMICIVSLNPPSMPRELIAQTVWLGNPTTPLAIKRPPTPREASPPRGAENTHSKGNHQHTRIKITVTIKGRTGDPKALSSEALCSTSTLMYTPTQST